MTTPYERFLESKAVSAPERCLCGQCRACKVLQASRRFYQRHADEISAARKQQRRKRGLKPVLVRPPMGWLREQYEALGRDCVQIAHDLKIDPKTAWEWVRAAGIDTRKRGFGRPANWYIKGQVSGFAGCKHSAASRAKIDKATRERGGVPYLKNGVHWLKGTSGPINPHWRGGITPERQTFCRSPEWKACVKAIWKRDNGICCRCALDYRTVDRAARRFDLHHIDSFGIVERRADPDNLMLLCETCHYWVHSRQNVARLFLGRGHERQINDAA